MDCDIKGEIDMAINLYDAAYELEKAIRQSEEYTHLQKMYLAVNSDNYSKEMFEKFRTIQMRLQDKQMMGEEISQVELEEAQSTVVLVQQNEKIAGLIEAEQKMSVVIADLNQIIMKPLEELYGAEKN
jgi:cell fate (sporulation/competence/biofilm development) regulator YlbF (YheA/YmcA/DUF963 family)